MRPPYVEFIFFIKGQGDDFPPPNKSRHDHRRPRLYRLGMMMQKPLKVNKCERSELQ